MDHCLVGTPATQVHNSSQRLLWLLSFLVFEFCRSHSRWLRRKVPGVRQRPHIVFSMLLCWSQHTVPPADALVLQGLHHSNTSCHGPSPSTACRTHLEPTTEVDDAKSFLFVCVCGIQEQGSRECLVWCAYEEYGLAEDEWMGCRLLLIYSKK